MEPVSIGMIVGWALSLGGALLYIDRQQRRIDDIEKDLNNVIKEVKDLDSKVDTRHDDYVAETNSVKVSLARIEALLLDLKSRLDGGHRK